jgi:DMSO/TMAO reductase YedYZ molybdopterin-dependent catalytic subunit
MTRPFRLQRRLPRRHFLARVAAATSALWLAGCDQLSRTEWFPKVLNSVEPLNEAAAKLFGRRAMAQEFAESDRSPTFRSNGSDDPGTPQYEAWVANGFSDYALMVGGLVAAPRKFSLDELRALPSRTQITRHDCVEGWSAIGKWKGARLGALLEALRPRREARYVMFYCADPMEDDGTSPYYESIDMNDAFHPQTLLAYELNDKPLPIANGAPVRLRVERQLGYKHAKYVMRIELVQSFDKIAGGKGGYWEDQGYEWYAGI